MHRINLFFAIASILAVPAKADETLTFRNVEHVTSNKTQRVGVIDKRLMGVIRATGTASFPDGSTGTTESIGITVSTGAYGPVVGSEATLNGYTSLTFADGSELWFKYIGSVTYGESQNTEKGIAIVVGGKGRYAGAKGMGTYDGVQTSAAAVGPEVLGALDVVINIKK
jgi:hypothetical protein